MKAVYYLRFIMAENNKGLIRLLIISNLILLGLVLFAGIYWLSNNYQISKTNAPAKNAPISADEIKARKGPNDYDIAKPAAIKGKGEKLPTIPASILNRLKNEVTSADAFRYANQARLKMNETGLARAINAITNQPLTSFPECEQDGRFFFYDQAGKTIAEADFYYFQGSPCEYIIFYENGKKYGSPLAKDGVDLLMKAFNPE